MQKDFRELKENKKDSVDKNLKYYSTNQRKSLTAIPEAQSPSLFLLSQKRCRRYKEIIDLLENCLVLKGFSRSSSLANPTNLNY